MFSNITKSILCFFVLCATSFYASADGFDFSMLDHISPTQEAVSPFDLQLNDVIYMAGQVSPKRPRLASPIVANEEVVTTTP